MSDRLDTHFARAIRKYGPENFTVEIIDTAESQEELNEKEQYWIRYYDSIKHGYNETDATYKCGGNTYMSKTRRELQKISKKISKTKLGSLNPHARAIKCLNEGTGEELFFNTLKEGQEYFGEDNHGFISRRLNHKVNCLYLSEWNFAYQDEPYNDYNGPVSIRKPDYIVTDLITKKRKLYSSVEEIVQETGITRRMLDLRIRKYDGHFTINNYQIDILD